MNAKLANSISTTKCRSQPEAIQSSRFLSINESSARLGVCRASVYRLIAKGDLKKVKLPPCGKRSAVTLESVELLEERIIQGEFS